MAPAGDRVMSPQFAMEIELDEETHTYRVDGIVKPSVSDVLSLYFPPSSFFTEDGRERGKARHAWFFALSSGQTIENEPDPRIAPEISQFKKFLAEVRPKFVSGEVPYFDPVYGVCGKPDFVGEVFGKLSVVDWKPQAKSKRTQIQTASYRRMLNANKVPVVCRYELRISQDGYHLEKHTNPDDERFWPIFVAAWSALTHYK